MNKAYIFIKIIHMTEKALFKKCMADSIKSNPAIFNIKNNGEKLISTYPK